MGGLSEKEYKRKYYNEHKEEVQKYKHKWYVDNRKRLLKKAKKIPTKT